MSPTAVATLAQIQAAIASQLEAGLAPALPDVQVVAWLNFNPTPPSIDIYPADPFLEQTAFSHVSQEATFVVRARVSTADTEGGQELLLDLLDPRGDLSVAAVLAADSSFGGVVSDSGVDTTSGFNIYEEAGGGTRGGSGTGRLLGCEWRLKVEL